MRKIKFRGRSLTNGKWMCGDSIKHTMNASENGREVLTYIGNRVPESCKVGAMKWVPVAPETVGQFTGLLDRNGKEIYEGDVVFWIGTDMRGRGRGEQGAIFWDKHTMSWAIERDKPCADGRPCIISRPFDKRHLEVVGNIHDNPELMKQ